MHDDDDEPREAPGMWGCFSEPDPEQIVADPRQYERPAESVEKRVLRKLRDGCVFVRHLVTRNILRKR
jgi:hypothetical protein